MTETVDKLTTKIYAGSLFSPEDNAKLINIKIQLDNQMLMTPDATLAPIYYKAGNLYKAREYRNEAIDCYQTILENFGDTALAPKAYKELTSCSRTFVSRIKVFFIVHLVPPEVATGYL